MTTIYKRVKRPSRLRDWRIDELGEYIASINALNTAALTIDELKRLVPIYKKVKKPNES